MTTIQKHIRLGWEATDQIPMAAGRTLRVETCKRSGGGITTFAISVIDSPDLGTGFTGFSFTLGRDFSRQVGGGWSVPATEKNIAKYHAAQMADIAVILAKANAHYLA